LQNVGLIVAHRQGRAIHYSADIAGLRGLLGWLLHDCCGGKPETCAQLLDLITCKC
jgi:hypothetical protein